MDAIYIYIDKWMIYMDTDTDMDMDIYIYI